jgi:hypothetical protein
MDYPNTCEGYEPAQVPFHPIPQQTVHNFQAPRTATPTRPAPKVPAKAQAKMPKAQVLALVQRLKKGVIIGSIVCFGATIGLIVNQTNSVTASQTTAAATSSQSSSQVSTQSTSSTQNISPTQTNQGTSQVDTTLQGGGYGFGSTSTGQSVSGSHTS